MLFNRKSPRKQARFFRIAAQVVLVVLAGVLLTLWAIYRADLEMRENLLRQTRLVARAINVEYLKALSGNDIDLALPEYQRLKAQFADVKQASDKYRFIYLVGKRPDGELFFFVDNEPPESPDYSPPGQHYHEASDTFRNVFDTGAEIVEGPVTDRWGTWVSPLAPIHDPETGALIAVLGMDVEAKTWWWAVANRAALPVGLMLLLLLIIALRFITARSRIALRESKERFDQLAEQSGTITWEIDQDGLFTYVSHVVEQVLGFQPDELIGHLHFYDFHPEEGRERFKAETLDTFSRKAPFVELINQAQRKDGSLIWLSTNGIPLLDADGSLKGYRGADTDITRRIQAEEALCDSERRMMEVLYASNDAIVLIDDNKCVDGNEAAARIFGFSHREAFLQKHISAFSPPVQPDGRDSFEKANEMMRLALENGFHRFEWIHRRANGEDFPVEVSLTAVVQDGKRLLHGVIRDITDKKRAEENLRESEKKHRLLIEHAVSGVAVHQMVFDPAGKPMDYIFLSVNPAFERHTGLQADKVIGRHITEIFPGIEKASFIEIYGRVVITGEPISFEQYSEPLRRHFFINAYRISKGVFATVFTDITERKNMEEALQASEARMQAIAKSAQDAIIMMDPEGKIVFWNPAAERIFGYPMDEVLGKDLHTLLTPKGYHDAYRNAFPQFLKTGSGNAVGKTLELQGLKKDASEITVELALSAIELPDGWHAVGIIRDITDRKQAEEKLIESNRQLEKAMNLAREMALHADLANRAKSEFLANMSHEIRTPMNGIIGMTGLLLDTSLDVEQRHYAEIVRSSAESLLSIINDILDFSKIEAKKLDLERIDFDLAALLDDFAASMALRAHEKGLEFLCATEASVPTLLRGDPGRLRQILTNLAGNAIKFASQGEVAVRIGVESESDDRVLIRCSVRDTGIGIPKDKIPALFEMFTQVDASTTRQFGGTGLGLAISKQLAELMGGGIGVESVEGKGSEFWFTARFDKQAKDVKTETVPPANLQDIHILITDDNATSREILTKQMLAWGMRPEAVENGINALDRLSKARDSQDPFKLAVIDMNMPDMDGESLGSAIQAEPSLADTRMVMLTSLGTRGDAKHLAEIGFAGYLTKPVRYQELRGVLSLALRENDTTPLLPRPIATRHTVHETLNLFAGYKARILLAEDNIVNQQVALGILNKRFGLQADSVANGVEALRALETIPYDLILMDVQMPEMDGIEATRLIRNAERQMANKDTDPYLPIPIIAMTAHAMQGDRERCLDAGMNAYITKPVSPDALAEALERWLPKDHDSGGRKKWAFPQHTSKQSKSDLLPVWDKAGFMQRIMGDEELAQTVLQAFLKDIPRQMEALRARLEAGDAPEAERLAHSIKGASANIGAEDLRIVALGMEKAIAIDDFQSAKDAFESLRQSFEKLQRAINKDIMQEE